MPEMSTEVPAQSESELTFEAGEGGKPFVPVVKSKDLTLGSFWTGH